MTSILHLPIVSTVGLRIRPRVRIIDKWHWPMRVWDFYEEGVVLRLWIGRLLIAVMVDTP